MDEWNRKEQDSSLAARITGGLIEARRERDRKIAEAHAKGRLTFTFTRHGRLAVGVERRKTNG